MIQNNTKQTKVSNNYSFCKNIFSQAKGLMFSLKQKNLVFVFKKEKLTPLHMWFVFFPIDVIYLNSKKEVTELKANFKPFTFFNPKNKAQYILELEKGAINKSKTEIGDSFSF